MEKSNEGIDWLARFREVQPGIPVGILAEEVHALAMAQLKTLRQAGEEDLPSLPSPPSLRKLLFNRNPRDLTPEAHALVDPILEKLLADLQNDPAILDGRIRIEMNNLLQLIDWIQENEEIQLTRFVGADFMRQVAIKKYHKLQSKNAKADKKLGAKPNSKKGRFFLAVMESTFRAVAGGLQKAVRQRLKQLEQETPKR